MAIKIKNKKHNIYAVDLFCGAGGLTNGFVHAGINVKLGIDIDPSCEYPYKENNNAKFLLKSIVEVGVEDFKNTFRKNGINLLAGCAPCQTFSRYNHKSTQDDDRWWLLRQFSRLVDETLPQLVTMENVPGLTNQEVFGEFVYTLEKLNYNVSYQIVNCVDYGIPQQRQRLVLLASRLAPIKLLSPKEFGGTRKTVKDSIHHLPKIKAGEIYKNDPLHQSASLSEINIKRINASKPGGTWRDWDEELIADCHKKESGKSYPSVYGRMCWDDAAPTITTQFFGFGNGRFGHPEQERALSLREGAILQTFPDDYKFIHPENPISKSEIGKMIGNAVPVKLGEVIGNSIMAHVSEYKRRRTKNKRLYPLT